MSGDESEPDPGPSRRTTSARSAARRRTFLAVGGILGTTLLAGCADPTGDTESNGDQWDDDERDDDDQDDDDDDRDDDDENGDSGTESELLWRLGEDTRTSEEFGDYAEGDEAVAVPDDWDERDDWAFVPKGLDREEAPALEISYDLEAVPEHGVELSARITNVHGCSVPQMAVFSNDVMVGNVQLAGLDGVEIAEDGLSVPEYTDTYEVYVPPEFLEPGANTLELRASRDLYTGEAIDPSLYWEWETITLESLGEPADEPLHGRYVRMGTTIDTGGTTGEGRSQTPVVDYLEPLLEWLGIAHSGNTIRMGEFEYPTEYLETVRDLNTSVCALHIQNYDAGPDPDRIEGGELSEATRAAVDGFLEENGDLIEYYQIGNEPSIFGGHKDVAIELAKYVQEVKGEYAPHLQVTAPGWFYVGYEEYPEGWAADPAQRREVEKHCDLTDGHAYGHEYCDGRGANLVENAMTFEGTGERGLPKPMMVTEMGTNDWHTDHEAFDSSQPHASMFDRISRAHVGFADHFMQHAAFFYDGFALFEAPEAFTGPDAPDPEEIAVYPGVDGEDPRVKTYRRIALAYATHGAPLSYEYTNREEIEGEQVYVRVVETSALGESPTGGSSEKVLVNVVNFEDESVTVDLSVTMPESATYEGDRYGQVTNGTTYADAHSTVTLEADPAVEVSETLEAGQAVQYVLERS